MGRNVAVFDFDGTIYNGDSFVDFAKFSVGIIKFVYAVLRNLPYLIGWKLGVLNNGLAKQKLFSTLFKGTKYAEFKEKCNQFEEVINKKLNADTISGMESHINNGDTVYIVTASCPDWISTWGRKYKIKDIIGTEIEVKDGRLTGHFETPNCHGREKKKRLLQCEPDRTNYKLYMYGDSRGDHDLMKESDVSVVVKNNKCYEAVFRAIGFCPHILVNPTGGNT